MDVVEWQGKMEAAVRDNDILNAALLMESVKKFGNTLFNNFLEIALLKATIYAKLNIFKMLIDLGANPRMNIGSEDDMMSFAIKDGSIELIRYLLECGIEIPQYVSGTIPRTPLEFARECRNIDLEEFLLEHEKSR